MRGFFVGGGRATKKGAPSSLHTTPELKKLSNSSHDGGAADGSRGVDDEAPAASEAASEELPRAAMNEATPPGDSAAALHSAAEPIVPRPTTSRCCRARA